MIPDAPLTISEITRRIAAGEQTAVATVEECFARIDAGNAALNAVRETYGDEALRAARASDERIAAGREARPLEGLPVLIKDNIASTLGTTACGSRMLKSYRSPFDATAVERLQSAGAVIVGRTNCDEFAMGSSTEHCAFGPVRNPWDRSRVPGGSSGGSSAAVAMGFVPAALGSDTGGSVRQPASFCGVVGLKPCYGRVSRYGLVAYGSSLDCVGLLTRTVGDAARMLEVLAGYDRRDSTCANAHVPRYADLLGERHHELRIGVPRDLLSDRNDPAVNAAVEQAIEVFRSTGATIVDIVLPLTEYAVATYYVIAPAEASCNLARYDGIRFGKRAALEQGEGLFDLYAKSRSEGFGAEVQRRIMLGTFVLSAGYYDAYYRHAMQVRRLIKEEFAQAFAQCHAILGPVAPTPAFPLGSRQDPVSMYLGDIYTTVTNIAGHCAISLPAGFASADGAQLPVGVQLQCPPFEELRLLQIAQRFQRETDHHLHMPPQPIKGASSPAELSNETPSRRSHA